ncbi:MAG: phosphate/phosphite/phosphonate ABC transporter substrate-binding protein [Nitrospina sp.]|jgi:phosphonate transport system substrate-binding protein|nr:phosphate/phosphite/phosphonate ABC transporter substrate-binding protein [Nitrospina sp.]MBT3857016.1 phosphate/phosphite/phosphonate ABC transporter substrate-binding protein [Nitrospina sp.]MBT4105033.1 phosphate/phosphite/phosphonate ABC transporter substrate-binding protein [Nitrospina sp.]MBT4388106.1 phosphate/phosphite/phosphonate ABC transporter substrate-binding protein [Nitrospina sp.]MBT4619951.1 phosphate/phosphite/phosphonate ABC transporter substrate-binding protein [Nitrospin
MRATQLSAIFKVAGLFVALSVALSCSNNNPEKNLLTINVGVLPGQKKEALIQQYQPLLDYLHKKTGLAFKLTIPTSYSGLINLFEDEKLDLVNFGGTAYVKARKTSGAIPLVMRGKDLKFTSSFITSGESNFKKISDFKNKPFAFGSKLSTSGHIMPRFFMGKENIIPETFFSNIEYSGKHDLTVTWVRDGRIDLGVVNSFIIQEMFDNGELKEGEVRVLRKTPPYADYVWAVQKGMSKSIQIMIRDAFLALSLDNSEHTSILDGLKAEHYLPSHTNDFSDVREAIESYEIF